MATYWIGPSGNDGNPGSQASPWATFAHANTVVVAGDTVYALPGTYNENLNLSRGGTSISPVTYQSTVKWGASIFSTSAVAAGVSLNAPYLIFDGFDIQAPNFSVAAFFQATSSGSILRHNRIHNAARSPFLAGDGIGAPHTFSGTITIDGNWIYDIGYTTTGIGKIHGMYLQTQLANGAGRVVNNVVFNIPWGYGIHLWG